MWESLPRELVSLVSRFFLGAEDGEVDTAVVAMLHEAGVVGEVVVLAMLQDEEAIGGEEGGGSWSVECGVILVE